MNTITKTIALAAIAALTLSSCQKVTEETVGLPESPVRTSCFVEGKAEILVSEEMAAEIEKNGLPCSFADAGVRQIERIFPDAEEWEACHRKAGLHRWYRVEMDDALLSTKSGLEIKGELDGVEIFERQRSIKTCAKDIRNFPFNDPHGKRYQWHITNDGVQWTGYKKGADITVTDVYKEYTGGSAQIIVAVVDAGIELTHEDLNGVCLPGQKGGSRNFVNNNYTITAGDHGTHVAGIIGAINNNGVGGCGVAGGTDGKGGVRLMSCEVFGTDDKNGNFENAIVWAADNGALICNNSWGYEYKTYEEAKAGRLPASMKTAIDYFVEHAGCDANGNQTGLMKGGLVVFAAGNDAWDCAQPASYEKVLAVGAIGPDGRRTSYSNYGSWVDICAPGGEADRFKGGAAADGSSYVLSTAPGNKYMFMCGTSQACPMVSGIAALVLSVKGGPGFTCEDLREALINTASNSIVPESDQIGPLVNAYAAVTYGNKTPEARKGALEYICGHALAEGENAEVVIANPGESLELDCSELFIDPDGDKLDITINCTTAGLIESSEVLGKISLKALKKGTGTCKITATDPYKAHAELSFQLGVFDDSKGPAIYPNPVGNEYFMVGLGERKPVKVQIFNATGRLVLETEDTASVFHPLRIEMPKFAAGRYVVRTTYGNQSYNTDLVKL